MRTNKISRSSDIRWKFLKTFTVSQISSNEEELLFQEQEILREVILEQLLDAIVLKATQNVNHYLGKFKD